MVGFLGLMTNRRSGGGGISFLALSSTIVVALYNQLRMTIKSSGGGSSSSGISVYNGIGNLEVPLLIDQMDQPRNLSSSLSFSSFLFPTTKFTVQQPPQQEQLQSKEEEISSSISSETVEYLYARYKNVTTKIRKSVDQEVEDDEEQNTLQLSSLSSSQPSSQHPPQPKPVYRKWAYVFLLGGCNSNDPEYRGFLYNTVVATKILQTHNTKADIVLLIQMSMLTNETSLPHDEEQLLNYYNIKIKYIPKFLSRYSETFYALVMEKFRILSLVEYSRVLFLDGDIMPYCSLDYIFELSEPPSQEDAHNIIQQPPPLLKENVIISWKDEPANAGLFMLKPNLNEYKQIQRIIIKKEKKALQIGHFPWWDPIEGWGQIITPDDAWRSEYNVRGTNWTWHASFADQGLLYYWTKYIKHNVSQIIGNEIDHYTSGIKTIIGKDQSKKQRLVPVLEATTYGTLSNFTCSPTIPSKKNVPHRDFIHFTGTYFYGGVDIFPSTPTYPSIKPSYILVVSMIQTDDAVLFV